jgi:type IV pilus assembly protein PilE
MMHTQSRSRKTGFTLVELMVTVAIIGILAMVAVPQYSSYVDKTRRKDAQGALMAFANAMERFWTENRTYVGATVGDAGIFPAEAPLDSVPKVYNLSIQSASASAFTLRATPKNAMDGDGYLEITNTGEKHWDKNNDKSVGDNEKSWE